MEDFKANRESLNRQNQKDDDEARADFWSIQGDFVYRHRNEPRVQLHVPKEETFTIPLKYIGVTRSTFSDLHVIQEKRIDDCWNVDSNRSFCRILGNDSQNSLSWRRNLPEIFCGPGRDWHKFKRQRDHIMYGLKYGPKLGKPLRI